jgi:hypothetical protein
MSEANGNGLGDEGLILSKGKKGNAFSLHHHFQTESLA